MTTETPVKMTTAQARALAKKTTPNAAEMRRGETTLDDQIEALKSEKKLLDLDRRLDEDARTIRSLANQGMLDQIDFEDAELVLGA